MSGLMVCDVCGDETSVRHGIDLRRDVWCCDRCLRIYRSIRSHYSRRGYSNERCVAILRRVVEKQKMKGRWAEKQNMGSMGTGENPPSSSLF